MNKLICNAMKDVVAQAKRDKQARADSAANGTAGPVEQKKKSKISFVGLITALAFCGLMYYWLVYDVSVELANGSRVVNLGLMQARQNGIIVCGILTVLGSLRSYTKRAK